MICGIPDLHAAVVGSGAVAPFETHIAVSTTSWIGARVPFKRTDILHQIATVPGLDPAHPIVAEQPGDRRGGAALAARADRRAARRSARRRQRHRGERCGGGDALADLRGPYPPRGARPGGLRGAAVHAVARRRTQPGGGQGRARRVAERSRCAPTARCWCARCSRASPTTRAGCSTPTRSSSSGPSPRSASSAAARRAICGARSTPTSSGARSSRWPTPGTRSCAASPCGRGSASASSPSRTCRRSCPSPATFTPSVDTRAYADGYAEYRKLFGKLKGLYHRLNARKVTS